MRPRAKVLARWMLLAAIVAASSFLGWWTWRTTAALERLGERSVIDSTVLLVREKLDRVEAMIIAADNAVIHLVDPDDLDVLAARWPALADRVAPTARTVLVLDHQERPLRVVSRTTPDDAERFRALFESSLRAELHLRDQQVGEHRHWHGAALGQWSLVTYFVGESAGRRYFVVIETDLEFVRREVLPKLFDDPLARGRFNVTDDQNRTLYGRSLASAGELVSARFPTTLYKWRIAAVPRDDPEIKARERSRQLLEASYVGLSLVVILVGVVFFTFVAREEERLNQLKSDFIATVSHELKTPLSLIRMFGEMLATDRVPSADKRRQYLDIIVRESERLTALIDNVLDFARLERGRTSYEFAMGDLGSAVFRGVEMFRYRVVTERPKLVTDIAEALPRTRLDERALQLLLFNLLDNAVKYAGDSDEVVVRVRAVDRDLTLDVEDRGPGIDPDDARRIFERFYRGRRANSSGARGSGIGLALVKHIAQAHGGDVSVIARAGGGTIFRVRIPIAQLSDDEAAA